MPVIYTTGSGNDQEVIPEFPYSIPITGLRIRRYRMKNKRAFIAGILITCSIPLHAQDVVVDTVKVSTGTLTNPVEHDRWIELQQIGSKNLTAAIEIPDVYQICCKTNIVTHHPSSDWIFPEEITDVSAQSWIGRTSIAGRGKSPKKRLDYQWINEPGEQDNLVLTDTNFNPSLLPKEASKKSIFNPASENNINDWIFSILTNEASTGHAKNKPPAQVIVIEPLENSKPALTDTIQIPEYGPNMFPSQHAWYEWIDPQLFLVKWAEYWLNGTTEGDGADEKNPPKIVLVQLNF